MISIRAKRKIEVVYNSIKMVAKKEILDLCCDLDKD